MYIKTDNVKNGVLDQVTAMETGNFDTDQILNLMKDATNIAVVPSKVAGADAFFACAGLYMMLKDKYQDATPKKNVKFLFAGKIPDGCENIISNDELVTNITDRELLLSVDFSGTNASKVQYSTEDETLFLKLGPIPKHFDQNRIKAKITGFDFDLVFVVGAQELGDLGPIYNNLRAELNKANKVVLDISSKNQRFGVVNIIEEQTDSLSTLVFKKASSWNLVPNKNAAKALLSGITFRNGQHG